MILRVLFILLLFVSPIHAQSNFEFEDVKTNVPQTEEVRKSSSELLQKSLYELIDQYHALQQMHWNTRGPHFISIHELTEEFYTELEAQVDVIAERKLALGYPADGNPEQVSIHSGLENYTGDYSKDYESTQFLITRYSELSERLGERIEASGENDIVTQDVLIGLRSTIDHHLYLLSSFSYK